MDTKYAKFFETVVLKLPSARRQEVSNEIQELQKLLNSSENLLIDQRKIRWLKATEKPTSRLFKVTWRGSDGFLMCSLPEAAAYVGVSAGSLRAKLSKNQGKAQYTVDEFDIITITKHPTNGDSTQ